MTLNIPVQEQHGALSPSAQNQFNQDGYVILRSVLDESILEPLRNDLNALFRSCDSAEQDIFTLCEKLAIEQPEVLYRIYQFTNDLLSLRAIGQHLLPFSQCIAGSGIYAEVDSHVLFAIPNDDRLTWRWHQEVSYDLAAKETVNFCFPLFAPATRENGTMSVLKGSHLLGPLPFTKHKPTPDSATSLIPEEMEKIESQYEEVFFEAAVGDVIMFHNCLIHRSNKNTSEQPRITGINRFSIMSGLPDSLAKDY